MKYLVFGLEVLSNEQALCSDPQPYSTIERADAAARRMTEIWPTVALGAESQEPYEIVPESVIVYGRPVEIEFV